MKRFTYTMAMMLMISGVAKAQDHYDAADNAMTDLNGTARFVAMGGALGALGADITTMGTNPAGTALIRKSDCNITFGGQFTQNPGAMGQDRSRASLDNAGVIFSFDAGNNIKNVNFGVNYRKVRNFLQNQNFLVGGLDGEMSQSNQIARLANSAIVDFYNGNDLAWGMLADMSATNYDKDKGHGGILFEGYEIDPDDPSKVIFNGYYGIGAQAAEYHRAVYGNTSQIDVNVSFNSKDRIFVGASLGIYTMEKNRESFYAETSVPYFIENKKNVDTYDFTNWYRTRGTGIDFKLGVIVRPIEASPLRFGFSVHTPTFYSLRDYNGSKLYYNGQFVTDNASAEYSYKYRTPWKINASVGHTIGRWVAIGAEYEWQDVSAVKLSNPGGGIAPAFQEANDNARKMFRSTHTIRLGVEVNPVNSFSLRLGYNYVTSPYKANDAYLTMENNWGSNKTETDYTNWGAINRITAGIGYRFKRGYIDLTYQHQRQSGEFYAFDDNDLTPTTIQNNRNQLIATVGFKF